MPETGLVDGLVQMIVPRPDGEAVLHNCAACGNPIRPKKPTIAVMCEEIFEWVYTHWQCMADVMNLQPEEERVSLTTQSLLEMERQLRV